VVEGGHEAFVTDSHQHAIRANWDTVGAHHDFTIGVERVKANSPDSSLALGLETWAGSAKAGKAKPQGELHKKEQCYTRKTKKRIGLADTSPPRTLVPMLLQACRYDGSQTQHITERPLKDLADQDRYAVVDVAGILYYTPVFHAFRGT
jgi:hypothetical protein